MPEKLLDGENVGSVNEKNNTKIKESVNEIYKNIGGNEKNNSLVNKITKSGQEITKNYVDQGSELVGDLKKLKEEISEKLEKLKSIVNIEKRKKDLKEIGKKLDKYFGKEDDFDYLEKQYFEESQKLSLDKIIEKIKTMDFSNIFNKDESNNKISEALNNNKELVKAFYEKYSGVETQEEVKTYLIDFVKSLKNNLDKDISSGLVVIMKTMNKATPNQEINISSSYFLNGNNEEIQNIEKTKVGDSLVFNPGKNFNGESLIILLPETFKEIKYGEEIYTRTYDGDKISYIYTDDNGKRKILDLKSGEKITIEEIDELSDEEEKTEQKNMVKKVESFVIKAKELAKQLSSKGSISTDGKPVISSTVSSVTSSNTDNGSQVITDSANNDWVDGISTDVSNIAGLSTDILKGFADGATDMDGIPGIIEDGLIGFLNLIMALLGNKNGFEGVDDSKKVVQKNGEKVVKEDFKSDNVAGGTVGRKTRAFSAGTKIEEVIGADGKQYKKVSIEHTNWNNLNVISGLTGGPILKNGDHYIRVTSGIGQSGEKTGSLIEGYDLEKFSYIDSTGKKIENKTTHNKYIEELLDVEKIVGVPIEILINLVYHENPKWTPGLPNGNSSAKGLGQILDGTRKGLKKYELPDRDSETYLKNKAKYDLLGAAYYLKEHKENSGNWLSAIVLYHTGGSFLKEGEAPKNILKGNPAVVAKIPEKYKKDGITRKEYVIGATAYYGNLTYEEAKIILSSKKSTNIGGGFLSVKLEQGLAGAKTIDQKEENKLSNEKVLEGLSENRKKIMEEALKMDNLNATNCTDWVNKVYIKAGLKTSKNKGPLDYITPSFNGYKKVDTGTGFGAKEVAGLDVIDNLKTGDYLVLDRAFKLKNNPHNYKGVYGEGHTHGVIVKQVLGNGLVEVISLPGKGRDIKEEIYDLNSDGGKGYKDTNGNRIGHILRVKSPDDIK